MSERHTLVGLPHPRAEWAADLLHQATSGAAPVEFLTCLTADEVRAVLGSGRRVSAVLLDGASTQVDRDVITAVTAAGATPIGVEATASPTDWDGLGCAAVLPTEFTTAQLADALARHCGPLDRPHVPVRTELTDTALAGHGRIVAVSGPGGTGASCVAMALAQGLAEERTDDVVLIDGARRGDLAMYHDVGDVLPGLPEVIDRVRRGTLDPRELDDVVFESGRGYDLLLGHRRAADWSNHRRSSVEETIAVLPRRWGIVVIDHDGEVDRGPSGSSRIEDRNAVSLALVESADLWVIVAGPGLKGLHDAARAVDEAAEAGVPDQRIQVVCNRVGRSPAARSAVTGAFAQVTSARDGCAGPPTFLGDSARLEAIHRDAAPLPTQMVKPLTATARRLLPALVGAQS